MVTVNQPFPEAGTLGASVDPINRDMYLKLTASIISINRGEQIKMSLSVNRLNETVCRCYGPLASFLPRKVPNWDGVG